MLLYIVLVLSLPSWQWRLCNQIGLSVILSIRVQDYCKSNQPISSKLGVIIGSTNWKNWLTGDGGLVPHTDCRSLLHFRHHCRIGDFRRLLAFLVQSSAEFYNTRRNGGPWQGNELQHLRSDQQTSNLNPVSTEIWITIRNHFWLKLHAFAEVCTLSAQSSYIIVIV